MAHDVFISHSAQNREVADTICATLEKAGIRCWVAPRDVRAGRAFPGEITRAIQRSKVMLLIFSRHSNNSEQVLREVQLATDSRLPLVRFRIEDVSMNDDLKYFLSTPHWLDALTPPLSGHVARLETAIKELLSQSVEVSGKDVGDEPPQPDKSPATPFAVLPAAPSAPPPPIPKAAIGSKESATAGPSPAKIETRPTARKSATPWIILAIAAVAVIGGIICVVSLILLQNPKEMEQQASTSQSQNTVNAETTSSPASSPSRVAKAKQKPVSQPAEPTKTTKTTAETNDSSKTESESAFERAGSLKGRDEPMSEPESEPANAFDRAGRDIGSADSGAEPSPEDE